MSEDNTPEFHQNPYHPFEESREHQAFQNGWKAHQQQLPRASVPYNLSQVRVALAWLDGWTAAQEQDGDTEADPWRPAIRRRSDGGDAVAMS